MNDLIYITKYYSIFSRVDSFANIKSLKWIFILKDCLLFSSQWLDKETFKYLKVNNFYSLLLRRIESYKSVLL